MAFVVEEMQSLVVVESRALNKILNLIPDHQKNSMTRRKITKRIENKFVTEIEPQIGHKYYSRFYIGCWLKESKFPFDLIFFVLASRSHSSIL